MTAITHGHTGWWHLIAVKQHPTSPAGRWLIYSSWEGRVGVGGLGCFGPHKRNLVKFTFRADPLQKVFRGTLSFEVNFTSWGYPCQKCLRGRFDDLVKFTLRADPRQKAFCSALTGVGSSKVGTLGQASPEMSFAVEPYQALDGSLADGAKPGCTVGLHPAVFGGPPYALRLITAPLKQSHSGNIHHILPL